jgi:hypothetical protein
VQTAGAPPSAASYLGRTPHGDRGAPGSNPPFIFPNTLWGETAAPMINEQSAYDDGLTLSSSIIVSAPLATVASAGLLPQATEIAAAPLATVAAAGLLPAKVIFQARPPLAAVPSAGLLPRAAVKASAPLATVTSAGLLPKAVERAQPPLATVSSAGLLPKTNLGAGATYRGPWYRPIIETLRGWSPWWRQS